MSYVGEVNSTGRGVPKTFRVGAEVSCQGERGKGNYLKKWLKK